MKKIKILSVFACSGDKVVVICENSLTTLTIDISAFKYYLKTKYIKGVKHLYLREGDGTYYSFGDIFTRCFNICIECKLSNACPKEKIAHYLNLSPENIRISQTSLGTVTGFYVITPNGVHSLQNYLDS